MSHFVLDFLGALPLSLTHPTSNAIATLANADRELLLDVLWVNEHQVWLDHPDWREQVEEAFQRGVSVSLIARPDARMDLKLAILSLAAEPGELGFLQVYPHLEGVQRHPRGFAVREAVQ
jgi:hypothetical protein